MQRVLKQKVKMEEQVKARTEVGGQHVSKSQRARQGYNVNEEKQMLRDKRIMKFMRSLAKTYFSCYNGTNNKHPQT